jgi:hypothetical protein
MPVVTAEEVKVSRNINIASLVTNVPGLAIWIGVLARIIITKAKLCGLVLICCLMITSQITIIMFCQLQYTLLRQYEGNDSNFELYNQA